MKTSLRLILILLIAGIPGYCLSSEFLPENTVIREAFKPGIGPFAGRLISVQDLSAIIHSDKPEEVYKAIANLPLYKEDTLIALNTGRVSFELNDSSLITIANNTKLIIDKSIYESDRARSAFLNMIIGKTRMWVNKLGNLKYSEFVIKTPSIYVGVRGSDFVIEVTEDITRVYAMENTRLEIIILYSITKGYYDPDHNIKIHTLDSYQKVAIGREDLTFKPEPILSEEIEVLEKEFPKPQPPSEPIRKYDVIFPTEKTDSTALSVISGTDDMDKTVLRQERENIEHIRRAKGLPDYPKEPAP
jgi:hypothetical protein